jgi:hypothetical protein
MQPQARACAHTRATHSPDPLPLPTVPPHGRAYKREAGRKKFGISSYSFAQMLYKDLNSMIDKSDYLGDAAKYIKVRSSLLLID